jgi:hypothetical protein
MVNQLKEQAEILKTKYAENNGKLTGLGVEITGSSADVNYDKAFCTETTDISSQSNSFSFDEKAMASGGPKTTDGQAVWINNGGGSAGTSGYTDFYVRGCWLTIGGNQKTDNAQFIVRLNNE